MKAVIYFILFVFMAVGYPLQSQRLSSIEKNSAKVTMPVADGEEVPVDATDAAENDQDVTVEFSFHSRILEKDLQLHIVELEILFESQTPDIVIPPPKS